VGCNSGKKSMPIKYKTTPIQNALQAGQPKTSCTRGCIERMPSDIFIKASILLSPQTIKI